MIHQICLHLSPVETYRPGTALYKPHNLDIGRVCMLTYTIHSAKQQKCFQYNRNQQQNIDKYFCPRPWLLLPKDITSLFIFHKDTTGLLSQTL